MCVQELLGERCSVTRTRPCGLQCLLLLVAGGGHLSVRVVHHWTKHLTGRDNLLVSVSGRALPAPLIERLLELPMDISSGTVDGEIHIAANDDATWEFPAITGKLTCRGKSERHSNQTHVADSCD